MPIRLVCPSCSATLSVKDEYAGRAVKCPKCAGVIPPSQAGAAAAPSKASAPLPPPPPPPPEPAAPEPEPAAESPFGGLDEPAKPKPKITGRPTGKPAAKGSDDDMDDDRPAKKSKDDDRDDEKPARRGARGSDRDDDEKPSRRGGRGGDRDDDDDRPSRGKRRRGDDDDDDRPKKKGGSGVMIVLILCGTLLLCCGGGATGVYFYVIKPAGEAVQKFGDDIKTLNFLVNKSSYDAMEVGETTRTEADTNLGAGKIATTEDLPKAFGTDQARIDAWSEKVTQKRAVLWRNGDDFILGAFSPTADGTSRLQAKEWRPKGGASLKEGELDDAKFLTAFPPGGGPGMPVTATDLAEAYKAGNGTIGDPKYKNKWLLVEGKVKELDFNYSTPAELRIVLEGVKKDGGGTMEVRVALVKTDTKKGLALSPGQNVKLKAKCKGYTFGSLDLENGTVSSSEMDPNPSATATALIAEYTKDKEATDEKYSTKFLTVTDATVESVNGDTLILTSGAKKGTGTKIQVNLRSDDNFRKAFGTIAVNSRVTVKGSYSQFGGSPNVNISYAWLVPK